MRNTFMQVNGVCPGLVAGPADRWRLLAQFQCPFSDLLAHKRDQMYTRSRVRQPNMS
jgi:hypothetical protein